MSPDHSKTYHFSPQKTILSLTFFHFLYSTSDPLPLSSAGLSLSNRQNPPLNKPISPTGPTPTTIRLEPPRDSRTVIAFLSNHLRRHISRCNPILF